MNVTRVSNSLRAWLCAAALVAQGATASAQPAPNDDALYRHLGGNPGLVRLMDDFMLRLLADPRMLPFFSDIDQVHVKAQLVTQFCQVSGGPCTLAPKEADMKKLHSGYDITKANFNALVEVLQRSMDAKGIAFGAQNKMLARLAPMHRDVITR